MKDLRIHSNAAELRAATRRICINILHQQAPSRKRGKARLTMSSRTSFGRLFLVLTAPKREFHPLYENQTHQLSLLPPSGTRGRTAISGALRRAWSRGVSPRAPLRSRMASPMTLVPGAGDL